jgi:hypothetical protein
MILGLHQKILLFSAKAWAAFPVPKTAERLLLIGNRIRANWYLSFNCHENVIAREIERSRTDFARLEPSGVAAGAKKTKYSKSRIG